MLKHVMEHYMEWVIYYNCTNGSYSMIWCDSCEVNSLDQTHLMYRDTYTVVQEVICSLSVRRSLQ